MVTFKDWTTGYNEEPAGFHFATVDVPYPADIGTQWLLIAVTFPTTSVPSGWQGLGPSFAGSRRYAHYKISDGTETGSLTLTGLSSFGETFLAGAIGAWARAPDAVVPSAGSSVTNGGSTDPLTLATSSATNENINHVIRWAAAGDIGNGPPSPDWGSMTQQGVHSGTWTFGTGWMVSVADLPVVGGAIPALSTSVDYQSNTLVDGVIQQLTMWLDEDELPSYWGIHVELDV